MPDQRVLPAKSPAIANDPAVRAAHVNNTNTNANSPSSSSSSLSSRLGLSLVIIVSALAILILSALLPMLVDNTGEKSSTLLGSEQSAQSISSSGFNSDSLLLTSSSSSSLSSPAPPSSLPSSLESPPPSSSSPEEIYIIEQNNLNNNDDDYNNNNNNNDTSVMTSTSVVVAATAHDDLNHVPSLPPTTSLSYLAEGAANVIYRLSSSPGEPQYHNKLLRLRKALPSAQPNRLAYAHLLQTFHPLFPDHLLLPTSLIRIPSSILIRENVALRALEAENKRPAKRQGLYLEEVDEEFGFLIMDMSPHPIPTPPSSPSFLSRALSLLPGRRNKRSSDPDLTLPAHAQRTRQLLIEFKPKWVLQSRSAPDSWRRCRTCALRLSKKQKNSFCPLDLSSGEEARVRRAVQYIIPAKQPPNLVLAPGVTWTATQKIIADRIVRYLLEGDLMTSLKKLHNDLDPYGPLAVQTMSQEHKEKFVSAMTVRDLTIFLRIDLDLKEGDKKAVDARIGDLDLKTGDAGKWNYWSGVEKKLRDEGYYAGTEEGAEEKGVWCRP